MNYNFLDSRWIYVDSLSNDTLNIGAIRYSGNAPAGKNLVRFYVDMQLQSVSSAGVHVMGNFQGWDPSATRMYSFDNIVYEYITYTDSNQTTEREYLFVNGNGNADQELLAGWCKNANGYRGVVAPRDTMLPVICYSFCDLCSTVGLSEMAASRVSVYPNPGRDVLNLSSGTEAIGRILITDILGNEVYNNIVAESSVMSIDVSVFSSGTYFVQTQDRSGHVSVIKWVKK